MRVPRTCVTRNQFGGFIGGPIISNNLFFFGGSAWQGRVTSRNDFASNAQFTFSGAVTGQGVGDFLTGNAFNFVDGPPKPLARCSSP